MAILGALSYGASAAAFIALAALLLVGWQGRSAGAALIVAVAITGVCSAVLAMWYWTGFVLAVPVAALEFIRFGAWILVLTGLARSGASAQWVVAVGYGAAAFAGACCVFFAIEPSAGDGRLFGMLWRAAGILYPLIGLILLEQLFRNTHAGGRRALLPLFIGVGGMLIYDLVLYSERLMTLAVGAEAFAARGFVNALCAPAIAIAARRNPQWSLDVFVSRQIVFYSTTFLAVGTYLFAMSLGGYMILRLGGEWAEVAQIVFFAGAAIVLIVLVSSGTLRSRLRVFLSTHFYRNRYDYRIEWLRFVKAMEQGGSQAEIRPAMIRAVAQIVSSHFGTLWVRGDDRRQLALAAHWSDAGRRDVAFASIDVDDDFVDYLERNQWIVDLVEYRRAPDVYQNVRLPDALAAPHDLRVLVPLMHAGRIIGLMGLGSPDDPFDMSYEDRDLLKTVGRHVATHLAQLEADRELSEIRQFEAYSRLTAFLMHDLKNLVAQLSLVVANAEKHRRNPEFVDDAIDTIRNSTDRMSRLIEQLQRGELPSVERTLPMGEILARVVERTRGRDPIATLDCPTEAVHVLADPERLTASLEHIVRNGQDATPHSGAVSLRLTTAGGRAVIQIADTGAGMSAEFVRDRLFRPFDSTKGSKGMGIGAYQVRDYVRSIGGEVSVTSAPGAGTIFTIFLPLIVGSKEH